MLHNVTNKENSVMKTSDLSIGTDENTLHTVVSAHYINKQMKINFSKWKNIIIFYHEYITDFLILKCNGCKLYWRMTNLPRAEFTVQRSRYI